MTSTPGKDAIRNAATVVIVRRDEKRPKVLMGQRGKGAAFMPSKFVFPGGAVDPEDQDLSEAHTLPGNLAKPLAHRSDANLARPLVLAAIRELWEEAGLALAYPDADPEEVVPDGWQSFFAAGYRPALDQLTYFFRAITPPGRPRRFDARFFLVEADALQGDPNDFTGASDELSHLSWLTLADARRLDLPFITEVVLAEVEARLTSDQPRPIPFFHHSEGKSFVDAL
ncbi:MAG: NUDIX hydrolase [Pseudomonadota bacterium]